MEFIRSYQNKLVVAIGKKDWQIVRSICETEKQFIDTTDENGITPLIHAVWDNVQDDLFVKMIAKASLENIEYKRYNGSTILHYLASYGRAVPLGRALEITKNPNLTNKFEKTPLDYYDENECLQYPESMIIEKKKSLTKLLIELSIPAEILARGESAIKAFEYEMQNGEITVVNARFMFMGKEGAGKTSLVNNILGKVFNEDEPSTDGIVTTTVFQTLGEDYSKWEEQTDVDVCELTKQVRDHAIAENVAIMLKQINSQQKTSPGSMSTSMKSIDEAASLATLKEKEQLHVSQYSEGVLTNQSALSDAHNTLKKKLPDGIHKQLVIKLSDKTRRGSRNVGPSDVTSIWDCAGQLKYYITHRFYLTRGSSYGVVFSLLDDLNALVKQRDSQKGMLKMTNLQMLLFWIRSIFEHAVMPYNEKTFLINGEISAPPISLIATHKDQLPGSETEKETHIKSMFYSIFDAIEGTVYEKHVDRTIYAVDNTAEIDEGIEKLKKNVGGYMKSMAKSVPTNWVDFQAKVQEAGKSRLRLSLDEIRDIAAECRIFESTLDTVLDYLNDTGIILYSKTNEKLKNTVITNLRMMIDFLTKIITVVSPDDIDKWPALMNLWHMLDNEGILKEKLLRHLWRHELERDASNFDVFLELMKMFGLLFEKQNREQQGNRTFIVPSRMQVKKENLEVKKDEQQTVSIYVTPTDFLPDAVYNLLVVAFLDLMNEMCRSGEVELFQNCSDFDLDDDHMVSLGAVKIENRHALKLEISHMIEQDENGKLVKVEPHPSFCIKILNYLRNHLKTVYFTTEGIGYKLRVLCSVCQPTQQPHFHDLEVCLKKHRVRCGKVSMSTSRLKRLFSTECVDASSRTMQSMPVKKRFPDRIISELELNTFSGNLGADWKSFVRSLGLRNSEIDHAIFNEKTLRDKIFSCLVKWRDREAHNATVKTLVEKCINHQIDVDVYEFLSE